eukprot:TRINITY_DN14700_c0_g1_i1.p1 TRINITY_DN14700_c0_g1~~TRINITY_DN14700_c0_g1_i1.p1  ORF type:complete len:451 (+),score=121.96 TRINITY_DN14700_c0_g1_i1:66-1355(+)
MLAAVIVLEAVRRVRDDDAAAQGWLQINARALLRSATVRLGGIPGGPRQAGIVIATTPEPFVVRPVKPLSVWESLAEELRHVDSFSCARDDGERSDAVGRALNAAGSMLYQALHGPGGAVLCLSSAALPCCPAVSAVLHNLRGSGVKFSHFRLSTSPAEQDPVALAAGHTSGSLAVTADGSDPDVRVAVSAALELLPPSMLCPKCVPARLTAPGGVHVSCDTYEAVADPVLRAVTACACHCAAVSESVCRVTGDRLDSSDVVHGCRVGAEVLHTRPPQAPPVEIVAEVGMVAYGRCHLSDVSLCSFAGPPVAMLPVDASEEYDGIEAELRSTGSALLCKSQSDLRSGESHRYELLYGVVSCNGVLCAVRIASSEPLPDAGPQSVPTGHEDDLLDSVPTYGAEDGFERAAARVAAAQRPQPILRRRGSRV